MRKEVWIPVEGCDGKYEVSNFGRVRTWVWPRHKGRLSEPRIRATRLVEGYPTVDLFINGRRVSRSVHVLVATAFIGPRPPGFEVAHHDGSRTNNQDTNLSWKTRADNHADKRRHGTHLEGSRIHTAKLNEAAVADILSRKGSTSAIAKEFGVSHNAVRLIRIGENWKHVERPTP